MKEELNCFVEATTGSGGDPSKWKCRKGKRTEVKRVQSHVIGGQSLNRWSHREEMDQKLSKDKSAHNSALSPLCLLTIVPVPQLVLKLPYILTAWPPFMNNVLERSDRHGNNHTSITLFPPPLL